MHVQLTKNRPNPTMTPLFTGFPAPLAGRRPGSVRPRCTAVTWLGSSHELIAGFATGACVAGWPRLSGLLWR